MTDYTSLYLLSEEERAYFVKLYEEITQGLLEEGIDYRPIRFDLPGLLTVEQITRINRSLSAGPIRALKAVQEAAGRKAFMFMRVDPDKTHVLPVEDFAAQFPNAPADHVKKNTYFSAPDKPAFVGFKEWTYVLSDSTTTPLQTKAITEAMQKPNTLISRPFTISQQDEPLPPPIHYAYPITPFTPEYFLLEAHPDTQDADPETLAELRDLLGLQSYRFIGLSLWEKMATCKRYLEETKTIIDAENTRKAVAGRATREKAAEKGAVTAVTSALIAVPSSKTDVLAPVYREMLTRNRIFKLRDEDKKKMDDQGRLFPLVASESGPQDLIDDPKTGFLSVVLSYVYSTFEAAPDTQGDSVKIYLPKFYEGTKIDPRPIYSQRDADLAPIEQLRYEKMISLIRPYEDCVGLTPDGSFYRLATVGGYEKTTETFTIYCPYLFECIRQTDKSRFLRLIHQDIANETNTAAVEVVCEIARGLITRGSTTPDAATYNRDFREPEQTEGGESSPQIIIEPKKTGKKKALFNYTTTFKGIISKCPQFLHDLEEIENATDKEGKPKNGRAQAYNSKLKQVFSAAFRILMEKTDFPKYYLDFTIENASGKKKDFYVVPTKTTIAKEKIRITHNGRNPDFTR